MRRLINQRRYGRREDIGVVINVLLGMKRRQKCHIMERRQKHTPVKSPQVHEVFEFRVHPGSRLRPILRSTRVVVDG